MKQGCFYHQIGSQQEKTVTIQEISSVMMVYVLREIVSNMVRQCIFHLYDVLL